MVTNTDYHGWPKPDEGAYDWEGDYYTLVNDLDIKVFEYGNIADRPASAPENAWYFAVDEGLFYRYVSGSWGSIDLMQSHGNEKHDSTFAVDGHAQPPEEHGNSAHSQTFAVDGDTQPPEAHGNAAHTTNYADTNHGNENHSSTFAVDGDSQPPEEHGNEAHAFTFAVDGDSQPPENHNNTAHSQSFVISAGGTEREIWVSSSGVPAGASTNDIVLIEE